MDSKKIGLLIKTCRQQQGLTQKQLAAQLNLSDKAISKWERGLGCPDISSLTLLAKILAIDIGSLLAGACLEQDLVGGNMKQIQFYLCPTCGNITLCTGNATVSCCGRPLAALTPQKATPENALQIEIIENDWYITSRHPMTKTNYISFLAFASGGAVQLIKQYPEWEIHCRIPKRGHGKLFWYSTSQGFFYQLL